MAQHSIEERYIEPSDEQLASMEREIRDAIQKSTPETKTSIPTYDKEAKAILALPILRAHILHNVCQEFKDVDVGYIMEYCLTDEAEVSRVRLDEEHPLARASTAHTDLNSEDSSPESGTVFYDVYFYARVPEEYAHKFNADQDAGEYVKVFVNLEIQRNVNLRYPLMERSAYYTARKLAAQKTKVFNGSDYQRLSKVYTIWICTTLPNSSLADTGWYTEKVVHPLDKNSRKHHFPYSEFRYNKSCEVFIFLGRDYPEDCNEIRQIMWLLFSTKITLKERLRCLLTEHNIQLTPEDQEDNGMVGLSLGESIFANAFLEGKAEGFARGDAQGFARGDAQGFARGDAQGFARGELTGLAQSVRNLMNHMHVNVEEALNILSVPEQQREACLKVLQKGEEKAE